MTDETKIHITMKINRGKETETFTGWLNSGTPEPEETLSVTDKPTFPDHLNEHLHVEDKQDHWRVTMNTYLAPETFKAIDTIIRADYKGKYEPMSKVGKGNQRWEIPKVTEVRK